MWRPARMRFASGYGIGNVWATMETAMEERGARKERLGLTPREDAPHSQRTNIQDVHQTSPPNTLSVLA